MTSQRIPEGQAAALQEQITRLLQADPNGPKNYAAGHPQSGFPASDWLKERGIQLPPDYQVGFDGKLIYYDKNDSGFDKFMTHVVMPTILGLTGGAFLAPALGGGGAGAGAADAATGDGLLPSTSFGGYAGAAPNVSSGVGMSATGASSTMSGAPSAMQSFLSGITSPGGSAALQGGLGLVSGILGANANNKNENANRQLTKDTTYLNSTQMNPVKQPIDLFRAAALRELASQGPTTLGGPHHDFSGIANQFLNDPLLANSASRFYNAQQQFAPPGAVPWNAQQAGLPPPPSTSQMSAGQSQGRLPFGLTDYFKRKA